jgi:hypothetical protein
LLCFPQYVNYPHAILFPQYVNYPHTMWAKDADGNNILQIKSESAEDLLNQANIKQVKTALRLDRK